jgi:hypothetical protein
MSNVKVYQLSESSLRLILSALEHRLVPPDQRVSEASRERVKAKRLLRRLLAEPPQGNLMLDDLMFLRETGQGVLELLQDYEWWDRTRELLEDYPNERAYDVVNRTEFAEHLNMLYLALHPDTDDDELQDATYWHIVEQEEKSK